MSKPGRKSAAELAIVAAVPPSAAPNISRAAPNPPRHLKPATKDWWRAVVRDYDLEPHHLRLLQAAGEAWDRCQEARAALDKHGLTFDDDRGNPKTRPEVAIERDARIAFARLVRELDLDVDAPREERSRPPALRSNRRA